MPAFVKKINWATEKFVETLGEFPTDDQAFAYAWKLEGQSIGQDFDSDSSTNVVVDEKGYWWVAADGWILVGSHDCVQQFPKPDGTMKWRATKMGKEEYEAFGPEFDSFEEAYQLSESLYQ